MVGLAISKDLDIWHQRLGHISKRRIKELLPAVDNFKITDDKEPRPGPCKVCVMTNLKREPFPKSKHLKVTVPNVRVHADGLGPTRVELRPHGHRYWLAWIDEATRRCWWISTKDQSAKSFLKALELYIAHAGEPMVILRTDGAKAYDSGKIRELITKHRIKREFSAANSPQQNAIVESNIRTIIRMARAIRKQANLPESFAGYAIQYAVRIYNSCMTKGLKGQITPKEAWTGRKPDMATFRVFGCKCWDHIANPEGKFGDRARPGIFLGMKDGVKGYMVYHPDTRKVSISRTVVFDERCFPGLGSQKEEQASDQQEE
jgi:transposase InsO family protein